jgi:5,10-methylenetetrahydrofolate reductase
MGNDLREKLKQNKFVVTVEIDPPKGANPWGAYNSMWPLARMVDAVNIADSPMARMRMSPIALAHLVQEKLELEAIFHLTCRDRNLMGLQSELLGAFALGVKNILTLTGDKPQSGDHPGATGVFDVDSIGLAEIAARLNRGYDIMDNPLDSKTDFFVGAVANPGAEDLGEEIERIIRKKDAGVKFFQTQPVFDITNLERFLKALPESSVPVIYGLLPLKSVKLALYLNKNVPGVHVPERLIDRLRKGGRDAGVEIARELLYQMRSMVPGVHIFPMGDVPLVEEILKEEGSSYGECSHCI